jgi:dehydrogenase/reductase SDR family member 7B
VIKDAVVLITGASSGIGEATAYAFARKGARLVLAGRNTQKLETVVKTKCISLGATDVLCLFCDVSVEADCQKMVEATISKFGTVHVLVNNAGISMRALFNELDLAVIKRLMDVNFWGTVYCTKFALPYLLANKGSLIAVSSVGGFKGLPARTGYSASKFAVQGFMESLRIENMKTGLHVGIMSPGYTSSNIRNTALNKDASQQTESPFDEKKLMPAQKVADNIVEMVENRSSFSVLTIQGKLIFWLNKFIPSWVDKQVFKVISAEKDSPFK